jgi:hypothetical protein
MTQTVAGPFSFSKKGRSKNTLKNAPNPSKLRRLSEKQKIEALEKAALNFVSILILPRITYSQD